MPDAPTIYRSSTARPFATPYLTRDADLPCQALHSESAGPFLCQGERAHQKQPDRHPPGVFGRNGSNEHVVAVDFTDFHQVAGLLMLPLFPSIWHGEHTIYVPLDFIHSLGTFTRAAQLLASGFVIILIDTAIKRR